MKKYLTESFQKDIFAGLTVSMIAIPQSMAYAAIGGLEPIVGLYAAMLPTIVGALFGSSRYLVTGATNAIALTTASILITYLGAPEYPEYAFTLAILSGLIMLLMGIFNLGGLIRFISNSVMTAFLAGAGCLILINQMGGLFGIERPIGSSSIQTVFNLIKNLNKINIYVVIISIISISLLIGFKKITSRIPAAFMAMVVCGLIVFVFNWHDYGVKVISDISKSDIGIFSFRFPNIEWKEIPNFFVSAFAIAILALVQTVSVAKPLAAINNDHLNHKKDFISQGLASMTSGFIGGMPTAGSLAQSAVNFGAGAQTKLSAVFSGVFVFIITLLFSNIINYIPTACLSSIVMVSAIRLINFDHIAQTWHSNWRSKTVLLITFISTLIFPLQYAIFIGTGTSIFLYLHESKNLKISLLTLNPDNSISESSLQKYYDNPQEIAIINIEGSMYFGSADTFEKIIGKLLNEDDLNHLILYMRAINSLGSTMLVSLNKAIETANNNNIDIIICGITNNMYECLKNGGIINVLKEKNVYLGKNILFASLKKIHKNLINKE